jgi:hypothetical protein
MLVGAIAAQSTDQGFPTPVRTNEITGAIKPRDVGDARLTSHYYTFEGAQGDLFINVQTTNFSGDIDVYVVPGLRPLTKMVLYADASGSETGRVVYLRKPETILLRIEGRTPGDEDATYRIKFAGGFLASKAPDNTPEAPKVTAENQSNIRVNSVGTILEVIPKPTPAPAETVEAVAKEARAEEEKAVASEEKKPVEPIAETVAPKQEVVVTDPLIDKSEPKPPPRRNSRARSSRAAARPPKAASDKKPAEVSLEEGKERAEATTPSPEIEPKAKRTTRQGNRKAAEAEEPDPMANVRLVIRFKDGSSIERPMTEVFKFTVERAMLTVISKDGTIGRYRMAEVAGVTIE